MKTNYLLELQEKQHVEFFGLFFLVFIGLLGSLNTSIYYILFQERNLFIIYFWRILFIFSCMFHLIVPAYGYALVSFFFKPFFLLFSRKLMLNIKNFIEKHTLFSTIIIYAYLCLLILHILMLFLGDLDIRIEFPFQFLNILKIAFIFPLIVLYVSKYIDVPFFKVTPLEVEAIKSVITDAIKFFEEMPKTKGTKGAMVAAAAVTFGLGTTMAIGGIQKNEFDVVTKAAGLTPESLKANPLTFADQEGHLDEQKMELLLKFIEQRMFFLRPSLNVGFDTVKEYFFGETSRIVTVRGLLKELTVMEMQSALDKVLAERALQEATNLSISSLASHSLDVEIPDSTVVRHGAPSVYEHSLLSIKKDFETFLEFFY